MKNINKYLLIVVLIAFGAITACEDEVMVPVEDTKKVDSLLNKVSELEEEFFAIDIANNTISVTNKKLQDSISKLDYYLNTSNFKIEYTVNVMSAANTTFSNGRVAGITGATVALHQNGQVIPAATTSNGLAVFKDLKQGDVNVTVTAPGYSRVEYVASIYHQEDETTITNASSNVVLYPLEGATIKGTVLANLNTENDTLNRKYTNGENAGKYLAFPGIYNYSTNFTQYGSKNEHVKEQSTIYSTNPSGNEISFEKLPAGKVKMYFYPTSFGKYINNGYYYPGRITSITYFDMIKTVTVGEDGTYEVKVPSSSEGLSYQLKIDPFVADHTRLTDGQGTVNEPGSVLKTVKEYDLTTNTTSNVDIRTITEEWVYRPFIYSPYSEWTPWNYQNNYSSNGVIIDSNLTTDKVDYVNIYLFPYYQNF